MGLLAMFRRKQQDAAEVSPDEAGADAPAEGGTDTGTAAEASEAAAALTAPVEDAADPDGAGEVETDEEPAGAVASEVVEIPKQQSAEAAADNEAGEGARH
ncbi:hypothetical protein ACFVZH_27595 [Streptomyces sp. NPDC059534]|uniref:hypothetical protein n=1 Tax=Streptomyces sp. NPDC059534 TaxID=3346859 RepID=UPI0036B1987D